MLSHVQVISPVLSARCMQATVEGRLSVFFYDTMAGERNISSKSVKARAVPHVLHVPLDASNVGFVSQILCKATAMLAALSSHCCATCPEYA